MPQMLPEIPTDMGGASKVPVLPALQRLSREPLLLFLVVGALIFGIDRFMRAEAGAEKPKTIELTADDVRQLSVSWLAQGRPAPNQEELKSLVSQKIDMEVLVREAQAMGLDKDDEVIKRRLAQKMDFLMEGVAAAMEPTQEVLRDWYKVNAQRFANPPRIAFHHLYFSLDKHDSQARAEAAEKLLANEAGDAALLEGIDADPFMFQTAYGDATPEQIAKEFGPGFATAVFEQPPGKWQGPITSGYGYHLVFIDNLEPGSVPAFEEIEPQIKTAWLDEQGRELKRKSLDTLRAQYTVTLPPLDDPSLVQPIPVGPSP